MSNYDDTNRGILFPNDRKQNDKHPDYRGKLNYNGVDMELAGWKKKDRNGNTFISLSAKEPYQRPAPQDDIRDDF